MDYRNKGIVFLLAICLTSCEMGEKKHKNVDPFYTQKRFGQQFALVPLAKPMKLSYDTDNNNWGIPMNYNFSGIAINPPTNNIGVQGQYVYGKVEPKEITIDSLDSQDIVYARVEGGAAWSKTPLQNIRYKKIDALDGKPDTYMEPQRWFVINAAEGTGTGFFKKEDYLKDLKDKGIEGKMYKSDSLLKIYLDTGVLEYFPEDIKTKLRR